MMFRLACSRGKPSSALAKPIRIFHPVRTLSGEAKQEIIQKLLTRKPYLIRDEFTNSRREQWNAAIRDFLPYVKELSPTQVQFRSRLPTRVVAGQHLIYFPCLKPTKNLLPDGTDPEYCPGDPWTQRLWAGGRIQFPQNEHLDFEDPQHVLAEFVRDVRISGLEGQEKIFVKIERRVAKSSWDLRPDYTKAWMSRHSGTDWKRSSEDDIGNALIVETRDLCFLREKESRAPFERRHIPAPTAPDYSHSLIPTPALLFRFSALTFNAHAIHIDPDYTRNVYGFPNLLVQGPLILTLMLTYMQKVLLATSQQYYPPVITDINYRNLAPLFANEEMTICIKKKESAGPTSAAPSIPVSTNGTDITKGFPTPPSDEDAFANAPQQENVQSSPSTSPDLHMENTSVTESAEYPQKWEIWVQTGTGSAASLAVRGTIIVEKFDESKQKPEKRPLQTMVSNTFKKSVLENVVTDLKLNLDQILAVTGKPPTMTSHPAVKDVPNNPLVRQTKSTSTIIFRRGRKPREPSTPPKEEKV